MATELDAIILSLAAWRGRHLRKAWRPIIASEHFRWQTVGAQFGGVPLLESNEVWPRCSECQLTMKLMLGEVEAKHEIWGIYVVWDIELASYITYFSEILCVASSGSGSSEAQVEITEDCRFS